MAGRRDGLLSSRNVSIYFIFIISSTLAYIALNLGLRMTSALVYVLGLMLIGSLSTVRIGLVAALIASLFYNVRLSEPLWRIGIDSYDDVMPLIAFAVTAVCTGALAGRLTDRARAAETAQGRVHALLAISDRLQKAVSMEDIAQAVHEKHLAFDIGRVELLDGSGRLVRDPQIDTGIDLTPGRTALPKLGAQNPATSHDIWVHEKIVASLLFWDHEPPASEEAVDRDSLINLISMAVERCALLQSQADLVLIQRSEELKTAILSSVSHDMRTPLAAISASASSLVSFGDTLGDSVKSSLLTTIFEQCLRLNRYTENLLNLGRLQAGISQSTFQNIDALDILGAVVSRIRSQYPEHKISKSVDLDIAIVKANEVMLEQVLSNILDNA